MKNQDFTTTLQVPQTAKEAFAAIVNIRGWWSEDVDGSTDELNSEFVYRDSGLRATMKVTELIPNKKIVWHVLESRMIDPEGREWNDTKLIFEITGGDKTQIKFTHSGLHPVLECYGVCSKAWTFYIKSSLQRLIDAGVGEPIKKK